MAQVKVSIGGRTYDLACHPGEESHLAVLAARVDAKAVEAQHAIGGNEVRQLLLAALLLADELEQGTPAAAQAPNDPAIGLALDRMADRLEALAGHLEKAGATS